MRSMVRNEGNWPNAGNVAHNATSILTNKSQGPAARIPQSMPRTRAAGRQTRLGIRRIH